MNAITQSQAYGAIHFTSTGGESYAYPDDRFEVMVGTTWTAANYVHLEMCPQPSNYIMIADSALGPAYKDYDYDSWSTGSQISYIIRENARSVGVLDRHNGVGNIGYGDGHVDTTSDRQALYKNSHLMQMLTDAGYTVIDFETGDFEYF